MAGGSVGLSVMGISATIGLSVMGGSATIGLSEMWVFARSFGRTPTRRFLFSQWSCRLVSRRYMEAHA